MQKFTLLSVTDVSILRVSHKNAVMENIQATHPLQYVHLDYPTIRATEGGKDVHMLIITDHFMQYGIAHTILCMAENHLLPVDLCCGTQSGHECHYKY